MSLRVRKKEEKKENIVRAGRELFAEKGFEATTTREIAKRASIGVGTLFVYFPTKLDLLVSLFLHDIGEVRDEAFESLDERLALLDALGHVFGRFYDYYALDQRLSRVLIKEMAMLEGPLAERASGFGLEFIQMLGLLVTRAKARGELPASVAEMDAAYHFFGAYAFGVMAWLGGAMPRGAQQMMLQRALTLSIAGLRHP